MATVLLLALLGVQDASAWTRFGPGSWAEHESSGRRDGEPVKLVEKTIFKDENDREVVISMETVDSGGGRSVVDTKYPVPQRAVPPDDPGRKTGEEPLTIDGKTYACEIREKKGVRRWICASVKANGGVLKSEAVSVSVQVIAKVLKLEEKVQMGKDAIACWVREETTDTGDQKTVRTVWMSDDVPGGTVRSKVRQTRGTQVVEEITTNLTGFEVVKRK